MVVSSELRKAYDRLIPYRILVLSIKGDKVDCDDCTLAAICRYWRPEEECAVPARDTSREPAQGVWTRKFANGSVEDLETGLGMVLALQAKRVEKMIETAPSDDETPADRAKREIEIDKQLDKVFKNGLALRNAKKPKAPTAREQKVIEGEIEASKKPYPPTPPMVAEAFRELAEIMQANDPNFDRSQLGIRDAYVHIYGPGTGEQLAIGPSQAEQVF